MRSRHPATAPAGPPRPGALRVVTLNLASGRGPRGQGPDAGALRAALAPLAALAPDVVAVQEVDAAQPRSQGVDQVELVAAALGLDHWRSAPALHGTPGPQRSWAGADGALRGPDDAAPAAPQYGVALLSRAPVLAWHALALDAGPARLPLRAVDPRTGRARWWAFPDEPRIAVAAEVVGGVDGAATGRAVLVAATHLSFAPPTARRQLRAVRSWLAHLPAGPAGGAPALRLLAGDLNLPSALLPRGLTTLVAAATFPAPDPRLQLDHVLDLSGDGAGGRAPRAPGASGGALALSTGDHRALVVDVTPDQG